MTMRITGSSSGMDYQAMVTSMLDAEKIPWYRLDNENYAFEQKQSAWTEIDGAYSSLHSTVTELDSYRIWQQMKATSSDEDVATATAKYTAQEATYSIDVDHLAESHRIAADKQSDSTSALNLSGTFTINGEDITVGVGDSLEAIRDSINSASANMGDDDKVSATIIDSTLVIKRNKTGDTDLTIADSGTDTVLKSLGILNGDDSIKNELQTSEDLQATVNGIAISKSTNSGITDIVTDVTFNFEKAGSSSVTIAHDTTNIMSLIEKFVDGYNVAMATSEAHTSVDSSGSDITAGILQSNRFAKDISYQSRKFLTSYDNSGTLDADYNRLSKIGIGTTGEDNRIAITDMAALESALTNNFDAVEDLFRDFDKGVIHQFEDYLDNLTAPMSGKLDQQVASLGNRIKSNEKRMSAIDRSLAMYEDQLWVQMGAIEAAYATMNSQLGQIGGMLGGMTSGTK